jgi:hypothetical protein
MGPTTDPTIGPTMEDNASSKTLFYIILIQIMSKLEDNFIQLENLINKLHLDLLECNNVQYGKQVNYRTSHPEKSNHDTASWEKWFRTGSQEFIRRLLTVKAQARFQASPWEIFGGPSSTGTNSLGVLQFFPVSFITSIV